MMRWIALLAACGGPAVALSMRIQARAPLELVDVRSVELYLIEGHTRDGEPLDCVALAGATPLTRDDLVSRAHAFATLQDTQLTAAQGDRLILIAQGYATDTGSGVPIASGCADNLRVVAGRNADVSLTLVSAR